MSYHNCCHVRLDVLSPPDDEKDLDLRVVGLPLHPRVPVRVPPLEGVHRGLDEDEDVVVRLAGVGVTLLDAVRSYSLVIMI